MQKIATFSIGFSWSDRRLVPMAKNGCNREARHVRNFWSTRLYTLRWSWVYSGMPHHHPETTLWVSQCRPRVINLLNACCAYIERKWYINMHSREENSRRGLGFGPQRNRGLECLERRRISGLYIHWERGSQNSITTTIVFKSGTLDVLIPCITATWDFNIWRIETASPNYDSNGETGDFSHIIKTCLAYRGDREG